MALLQHNYMCGHCFAWLHIIRMNYYKIKYSKIVIFIFSPFLFLIVSKNFDLKIPAILLSQRHRVLKLQVCTMMARDVLVSTI